MYYLVKHCREGFLLYKKFADGITKCYIQKGIISEGERAVYRYGFEILFSTIVYTIIFIIISILCESIFPSLFFWIGFFMIRKLCGGYHAKTYLRCHLLFASNHLLFIALLNYMPFMSNPLFMSISLLVCAIIIFIFAPVDHPNKPFSKNEYIKFRLESRLYCIVIVSATVLIYLNLIHDKTLLFGYMFGTISATVSLLSAKIQKNRRKT